jgi:hypothetical protein
MIERGKQTFVGRKTSAGMTSLLLYLRNSSDKFSAGGLVGTCYMHNTSVIKSCIQCCHLRALNARP